MRTLYLLMAVSVLFSACDKDERDAGSQLVPLTIASTNTPGSLQKGIDIVSEVKCTGPDLCYKFSAFGIKETASKQFEVRARATYPKAPGACPQAIYVVDTSLSIKTTVSGQHIIRFYNEDILFKADTIQVN